MRVVLAWVQGLRTRKGSGVSSSANPSQKAGDRSLSSKAVKYRENSSLLTLLFYPGLQWLGWYPPMLERAFCFTQCTNSKVNLIQKHPHRTHPELMISQISGHSMIQSCWHIQLINTSSNLILLPPLTSRLLVFTMILATDFQSYCEIREKVEVEIQ